MKGRPKRYENQADRQKAYRERKKAPVQALRKSPAEIWREKEELLNIEYEHHQRQFPKCETDYPAWLKEHLRLYHAWDEAHHRAYFLACYERDWFITLNVRVAMMPEIKKWLQELGVPA